MIEYAGGKYDVVGALQLLEGMILGLAHWPSLYASLRGDASARARMLVDQGDALDAHVGEARALSRKIAEHLGETYQATAGGSLATQLEARRTLWRHQAHLALQGARLERMVLVNAQDSALAAATVTL